MIPYSCQTIDDDDIAAVVQTLRSTYLTQGPATVQFEEDLASYTDSEYAVAMNSGTSALHAAYAALGVGPGDEVIVPANTFVATANAAVYLGATPVICDIREDTYNIDETKIEVLITDKTKVIAPVHFSGQPAAMDAIWDIAKKHGLYVVEDACQALGARYNGKKIGGLSDITVFSFHPVKLITSIEGGAATTNNKEWAQFMKDFRSHGVTKDQDRMMYKSPGPWYFEMQSLGFNYRMTDVQAALGSSQLKKLDAWNERRRSLARVYDEAFSGIASITSPKVYDFVESPYHLYVVRVPSHMHRAVFVGMRDAGIWVQQHHTPVHHHPYYKEVLQINVDLPVCDAYFGSSMSIPLYPKLTPKDQQFVIDTLKALVDTYLS